MIEVGHVGPNITKIQFHPYLDGDASLDGGDEDHTFIYFRVI